MYFEDIFYFTSILLNIFCSLGFAVVKMLKTKDLRKSLKGSLVVNALMTGFISVLWFFFVTSDGFAQVFGLMGYGIAFIVLIGITATILHLVRRLARK